MLLFNLTPVFRWFSLSLMDIPETIFREYDIRGLVDRDLGPDVVSAIQRAYTTFVRRHNLGSAVIVGRDSRAYNKAVAEQAVAALRSSGLDVIDIGVVTAPAFYFAQLQFNVLAGVMVTASHNPVGWTGFKHLVARLQTATTEELNELKAIISAQDFSTGSGGYTERDVIASYADDIRQRISLSRTLKVVVDCGNESTALINLDILRSLGLEVIAQCATVGEPAPHEPNPSTLEALAHLGEGVRSAGADLGVGYDADGDRFGIVDEHGEPVWCDRVAMIVAREVLHNFPGSSIVFDVKCTRALSQDITAHGGVPVMWKTGHSWIRRKAQEIDAAFAAERSGHFYFRRDHHGYDDGLFASLRLMKVVAEQPLPLSRYLEQFPHYQTSPVWHAPCADEVKYDVVQRLTEQLRAAYGAKNVIDINGARVEFPDGWGLVRASSNIPALVLVFEGETVAARDRIERLFRDILASYPEVGTTFESG